MRSLLLALPLLVACAEDVAKDKTAAVVSEPAAAPAPAPAPAAAPAGTALAVDKAKSKINALGAKITGKHDIGFPDFDAKLRVEGENVAGVEFTVQVASAASEPEKFVSHLKGPDFLDVEKFPTATFTSTEVKAAPGENGATHEVSGDFTLRGVTKRVTFPATLAVTPTEVTGRTEFSINRKDFGVVYAGKPDDLIQENVVLTIELAAPRS